MNKQQESILTGLWFFTAVPLACLFLSAAFQGGLTFWHFVLACILLSIAVGGTPIMLAVTRDGHSEDSSNNREKAKRQRIDNMLRDMSDEDLLELKKRLSDGDYNEDSILDFISDDGELITRNQ